MAAQMVESHRLLRGHQEGPGQAGGPRGGEGSPAGCVGSASTWHSDPLAQLGAGSSSPAQAWPPAPASPFGQDGFHFQALFIPRSRPEKNGYPPTSALLLKCDSALKRPSIESGNSTVDGYSRSTRERPTPRKASSRTRWEGLSTREIQLCAGFRLPGGLPSLTPRREIGKAALRLVGSLGWLSSGWDVAHPDEGQGRTWLAICHRDACSFALRKC